MNLIVVLLCLAASIVASLRWLRVAQREHYLPDCASRFALRWWGSSIVNLVGLVVAVAAMIASGAWPAAAALCAVVVAVGPLGLGLRGRSAPLAWTRRMKTLAVVWPCRLTLMLS